MIVLLVKDDNGNNKRKGKQFHKKSDWINLPADNRNNNMWIPGKVSKRFL